MKKERTASSLLCAVNAGRGKDHVLSEPEKEESSKLNSLSGDEATSEPVLWAAAPAKQELSLE